jgi:hypothetical protein
VKKQILTALTAGAFLCTIAGTASATIIEFSGGTAYLTNGSTVTPTDTSSRIDSVDYYIEDGIKVDFIGGTGILGNYYGGFTGATVQNAVIHAHWHGLDSVVFSKVDGTTMDLNYMDLSSNTTVGGGAASGNELSYITSSNGYSELLPSSDWGIDKLAGGAAGDGIERLWLDSNFDNILSFTVTSENAYCFGLDNFYIDEAAPNPVPEPAAMLLFGIGITGLIGTRRKKK